MTVCWMQVSVCWCECLCFGASVCECVCAGESVRFLDGTIDCVLSGASDIFTSQVLTRQKKYCCVRTIILLHYYDNVRFLRTL